MRTIRSSAFAALFALLIMAMPFRTHAAGDTGFKSWSELSAHYLQQRAWIAPIIPPLLSASLDELTAMIQKGDFSFQNLDAWYFPWADGPYTASDELAAYDGQALVIYEDLSTASIKIATAKGEVVAEFKSQPFPDLSALKGDDYDRAILAELNKRSVALWVSFQNTKQGDVASFGSSFSAFGGGGYAMMSMGGQYELEVTDMGVTNDGMAVTFAWPVDFTNRLDIYAYDGDTYNGLGSWKLADIGYSTAGTNQLRWVDTGQLARIIHESCGCALFLGRAA